MQVDKYDLCIYHANCPDGMTSAYIVHTKYPDIELIPCSYGDPIPNIKGRDVIMVDFNFKQKEFLEAFNSGNVPASLTILDHHKTAEEEKIWSDYSKFDMGMSTTRFKEECEFHGCYPVRALFDMSRSGAEITWDFLFPTQKRPKIVEYTADRDLWKNELYGTKEINAYISSVDYTIESYNILHLDLVHNFSSVLAHGVSILRAYNKNVQSILKSAVIYRMVESWTVPVINCTPTFASDVLNIAAKDYPFAVSWYVNKDGKCHVSLRSNKETGIDVSEIAKKFGGGGHKNAAGLCNYAFTHIYLSLAIEV